MLQRIDIVSRRCEDSWRSASILGAYLPALQPDGVRASVKASPRDLPRSVDFVPGTDRLFT